MHAVRSFNRSLVATCDFVTLMPALQTLAAACKLGRDDTCHPLLNATHHARQEVVAFLLAEGVSPLLRGTVHPYTGDNMTVSQLKGASRSLSRIIIACSACACSAPVTAA